MKKMLLAAMAALMLSGCELLALACDDDFDCSGDDFANASASPPSPTHIAR